MSDKGTKALKADNRRISKLVWKLHRAIKNAKEQDIPFTEEDDVRKFATDSFKLLLEHGVVDESALLHNPENRSPRPHLASPDRRQNVHTTSGSEFCDDVKVTLNFEDDQTHDSIERNPRKLREFEKKYKEASLENIRLGQELDRVKQCIAELEYQNKYLTYQGELAEKEKSDASRKTEEEIKDANDAILYYKEEQQRYKKAKDDNNPQIVKLRTAKDDANGRLAKLTNERDDANRSSAKLITERDETSKKLAKLRTERDESRSDAGKVEKDELLNVLQKQKSSNDGGRQRNKTCEDTLSKQLHETDMECQQSKKTIENLNRKLDEIESQQKEFLKPRDREDLKREENSNRKLIEENEELRNTVFEMEQKLAGQNREHIDTEHQYRSDIDRYRQERNRACSKLNILQEQMKNKTAKLKEQETLYYEDRKQLENRIQDLEDQISDRLGKPSQQDQLDPVREELSIMKIKLSSLEDELKINKDRKYIVENENKELNNKYQDVLRKLRESESRYSSQSNIEKENECLKHELTMSLMNIEKIKQEYKDLEKRLGGQNREDINTEHQYRSDIDRYRQERNRANSKLNTLQEQMKNKTAKHKKQETLYYEDRKQLENRIQDLEDQISDRLGKLSQQEQMDPMREELSVMKIKLSSLEDELKINKDRKYVLEKENEEINKKYQDVLRKLRESESSSQSDIEKENESLKHELTMSLMNIEKIKQDYKDLEKRLDTEMTRNKETAYRLQNDLDRLKSQQDLQKQTSRGELDSLKEPREKLESDKQILREKIYSLENEKIGLEERYKKETAIRISTDGIITKLKDEHDRLRKERNKAKYDVDRISREKEELAHELQHQIDAAKVEHDNLKKDKNDITSIFQQKAKRDQEKIYQLEKERETLVARDLESKNQRCTKCDQYERSLAKLMKENQELQDRYKKETAIRISTDGTITKLKDENDRLRKERNKAKYDMDRITREKEELAQELQHDIDTAKLEHDNLKKDKNELTSIFQEKAKRDKKKIDQLEKECETLVARGLESKKQRCTKCDQFERTLAKLKKENQELQDRLSVAAEKPMEEQTPFVGNLCDINRPTALADKFSSLYTDEYTDAMEVIERSMDEASAVHVMLEWLKSCNDWCERLAREQIDLLTKESIGFMNKYHGEKIDFVIPDKCLILVKEFQRQIADNALASVRKICHVKSVKQENFIHNSYIVKYIQRCSELCWRMQITNPPMCLKFDVKNGENLDKTLYNVYSKNGSRIEYLMWPILFLHKSGPLMAKGVAQGT